MPVRRSRVRRGRGGGGGGAAATPRPEEKQQEQKKKKKNPVEVVEPIAKRTRRRRAAAEAGLATPKTNDKEQKTDNERVGVGDAVSGAVKEEEGNRDLEVAREKKGVLGEKKQMDVLDSGGKSNKKPLAVCGDDEGTAAPVPDQ
ncbi:hypothetical protein OIU78_010577, partial [Salix suchowensis]